jgi:hypothetical protein
MADIRGRVEEDQGILKKIQMFVPGFRGYRRKEDLRDADKMLRMQLAQKIAVQRRNLEDCRALITKTFNSKPLDVLGGVISQFKKVESQVNFAEMGYSGISADIQIKEDELNRLYEYDAGLIGDVSMMSQSIDKLKYSLAQQDDAKAMVDLMEIKGRITDFEDIFRKRIDVIGGTEV